MRLRGFMVLLCVALALAGCARQAPRYAGVPMAQADLDMRMYGAPQPQSAVVRRAATVVPVAASYDEGPYTLDSGDKLRVVVFGQDTLSNNYTVDAEGQVALPLIGAVNARGLTTSQLSASIAVRLRQSYVRDPSVAVEIQTYRPFFMLGEITFPGQYPYVPNMTVANAIAIAGGFTPRAARDKVAVTRNIRGASVRLMLPMRSEVRPGDSIEVSERWF